MSDQHKAVAQRFVDEIWNRGDLSSVSDVVGPDLHFRSNQMPPFDGVRQLEEMVSAVRAAFPDMRFTIDETVAEADAVVHRWTFRGTHRGEFMGVAGTGKVVQVTGTATSHFKNGKIVEHIADWDALGMLQQMGAVKS